MTMNAIAVYKLEEAGFKRSQVEALVEFLDTQAVTKLDLEKSTHQLQQDIATIHSGLKQDSAGLRAELKQDIADLRAELKQDIAKLRGELKQDITDLRSELKQDTASVKQELAILRGEINVHRWILGFNTAMLIAVLLKLFLP